VAVAGTLGTEMAITVEIVPFAGMVVVWKKSVGVRLWPAKVKPVRTVDTPASSFRETSTAQLKPCAVTGPWNTGFGDAVATTTEPLAGTVTVKLVEPEEPLKLASPE
jgi:hypothetical protein